MPRFMVFGWCDGGDPVLCGGRLFQFIELPVRVVENRGFPLSPTRLKGQQRVVMAEKVEGYLGRGRI